MQAYNAPSRPFEAIHVDLTGPFRKTKNGNQYIAVAKCALTRAVELQALPGKVPIGVAKMLIDRVYHRHGSPRLFHSDQGTEFLNTVIEQISALYQVKHVPTTPGNPRSNGLAEQHMLTLKDQLSAFTNAIKDDWDTYLSTIQFAYMTTVNSQTGFTPFFLLYGREASQPHETWIGAFGKVPTLTEYVRNLVISLQSAWEYVAMQKPKEVQKMNQIPVRRLKFIEYEIGDRFFLGQVPATEYQHYADPKRTKIKLKPKMQIRYVGPYTVTKRFSPVLYEAQINGEARTVHALQMKPDPVSRYYTMHRPTTRTEDKKVPAFKPEILLSGKPVIPKRLYKKLRSPDSPLNNSEPQVTDTIDSDHEGLYEEDSDNEEL